LNKAPSHLDRTRALRLIRALVLISLCGLVMVGGAAILLGADAPRRPAVVACQSEELVEEVRYRDFGPTALVITRPCNDAPHQPYVVLASYISLVDADYYTGKESARAILTARDSHHFMYGWLARALARQGIASVRYDPIAVRSRQKDGKGFAGAIVVEEDLLRVRRTDFSGLLELVLSRTDEVLGRSSSAPVILVGHSGGAFTIGDFLERARSVEGAGRSRPYGFVGIAPAVSDATGIQQTHWRYWVRKATACLSQFPAPSCLASLRADAFYDEVFRDATLKRRISDIFLHSQDNIGLTRQLDQALARYAMERERAERAQTEGVALIQGRYRVQQRLFHELAFRTPSARPLSCHSQAAALVFGDADYILDPQAEKQAWAQACGRPSDVTVLPGVGHSLGPDPYYGPPTPEALGMVAKAIASVAAQLAAAPRCAACPAGVTPSWPRSTTKASCSRAWLRSAAPRLCPWPPTASTSRATRTSSSS
jgi:alpha-beta hydrolase superfamily lysophospholipase